MSRKERIQRFFLKPGKERPDEAFRPADELEAEDRRADDKERLIGLVAAPLAALIAIIVIGSLSSHAASRHENVGVYDTLLVTLLALSVGMLASALLRKRLFLGLALALYGLALFNLREWGFAVPFVIAGSWYLARAYRIHQGLQKATGKGRWAKKDQTSARIRASKRYTPPKR